MKKLIIGFLSAVILCGAIAHHWRVKQVVKVTNENAHNFWEAYYHDSLLTVQRQCLDAIRVKEEEYKQRCAEELAFSNALVRKEVEDSLGKLLLTSEQRNREGMLERDSLRQEIILVHRSYTRHGHLPIMVPSSHRQLVWQEAIAQPSIDLASASQQVAISGLKRDFGRFLLLLLVTPFLAGIFLKVFLRRG